VTRLLSEIRRLEALADRAWPAAEVVPYDGWELRATGPGIGRRVNSVAPLHQGRLPLEEKVAFVEAFYRQRRSSPTFKLTAASLPAGLEGFLTTAGYRADAPVSVRIRQLPIAPPTLPVRLAAHPSQEWRRVNTAAGGHYGAAPRLFLDLVARVRAPLAFGSVEYEGETAAAGMAVAHQGYVNLFEISTHPGHRRRGLARQVVAALVGWGEERGAATAYLQVMPANGPALALYQSLGFDEVYRYWYRVAPSAGGPSGGPSGLPPPAR